MDQDLDNRASAADEASVALEGRRRLLRAAAAAPLIATLPSGAAMANTSAYQCIVSTRNDSDRLPDGAGGDYVVPPTPPTDTWVRFTSKHYTVVYPEQPPRQATRTYYYVSATDKYYVGEEWPNVPEDYPGHSLNGLTLGQEFALASLNDKGTWTETSSPQDRNVLAMFQEIGDPTVPTGVQFKGIYPNQQRPTNMGMVQSCLCSVNPDLKGPNDISFC